MATAVLFIGFDRPHDVTQMDKAYGWLGTEGHAYIQKHQGTYFERFETIGLTAHGGDLNGAIILFGERVKLDELRRTDDFETFVMNLSTRFNRVGVVPGLNWDGIQGVMKRRNASATK